jgi:hypothetical protein
LFDLRPSLLGLGFGRGDHHEVIGVADEPPTVLVEFPVQVIENDVGQQRTDDASLGRAHCGRFEDPVVHHP